MSGRENWPAWATESVELVESDPAWAARGEQECEHLDSLLAAWLVAPVEHVGSTAVPGLAAKPVIDLQAAVTDLAEAERISAALAPHAWHGVDPELDRRPWRRFFVKVTGGRRAAHLHVMTMESPRWHQQIAFRDALRSNPNLRADYASLKRALAAEHVDDREAYTAAKGDFVRAVLRLSP